ncbi:hypothetical protein [Marinobacterium aestuariivivens]|uniref:Tetratricopeptide repeat protein n=1 Tax=Marinobacterium aestuariivivens TaxID=1698799 RepID=A0ABW1ZZF0_9GAMM
MTAPSISARRLGLGIGLLCALALAVLGGRLLIAGIAAHQAQSFLDDWRELGEVPTETAWGVAEAAARRAIAFYPGDNGDYYDRLGRVYEWRQQDLDFGAPEAQDSREQALAAYRQAVAVRPDWPDTWVQIAFVKLRLLAFDEEFDRALQLGFENGPWRLRINRGLATVGLIAWPQLDEAQRAQVLTSAARTVAHDDYQAVQLFGLSDQIDQTRLLCDSLPADLLRQRGVCLSEADTEGPPWPGNTW